MAWLHRDGWFVGRIQGLSIFCQYSRRSISEIDKDEVKEVKLSMCLTN
jgi:hypothetical protein